MDDLGARTRSRTRPECHHREEPSLRIPRRSATPRRYLMCPPTHFQVSYAINPWMDPAKPRRPRPRACAQWEDLRDRYRALGHTVEVLDAAARICPTWSSPPTAPPSWTGGCSARGSPTPSGRRGRGAPRWFRDHGFADVARPQHVNEGEGDFLVTGVLAPGRPRLPHRPALPRRGAGVLRPPGDRRSIWSTRATTTSTRRCACSTTRPTRSCTTPARSPRAAAPCCARLFPDA